MTRDDLLHRITDFYFASPDFNGIPLQGIDVPPPELSRLVGELVREGLVSLEFGDIHPNPHIKALEPPPIDAQIEKLASLSPENACAYPTPGHLARVVDAAAFVDRPFALRLHLGEPQLKPYFFDLTVLESYRNDPRYHYEVNDIGGRVSVTTEHYLDDRLAAADKVVLKTFGFAYDSELNRAVAAYLRYLHSLSPEHQRIWHAKHLSGDYKLHPDYWRTTNGHWPEGISIFAAFLEEMHQANELVRLIGRPPFFRQEFRGDDRPKGFAFLIRPTLEEFNAFVLLLDKMISENINLGFFGGDVPLEEDRERPDGRVVVERKGSLRVLGEWLDSMVWLSDPRAKDDVVATFKKIREFRQRPAHAIEEDTFDHKYFKDQRDLIIEAHRAMQTLRLIFALHPATHGYTVPEWLESRTIWTR